MAKLGILFLALGVWLLVFALSGGDGALPDMPPMPPLFTVVVDAGHGGRDPGAVVAGVKEKDVVLAIALRVFSLARGHPQLRVVLTRTADYYVDLVDRVRLAEEVGAALYVSIHANFFFDPSVCGVETLVDDSRPPGDPSWRLARILQGTVCAATGARDRGVRSQRLYLRHTYLPAVLVEVGFLSCPAERAKLVAPWYQEKIARGILQGILEFLGL